MKRRFVFGLCTCNVSGCCISFESPDVVCNELSDGIRYVGMYEFVNEFTNAMLMSSAIVIVDIACCFWLEPVAMVLFMLCYAVIQLVKIIK